MNTWQLVIYGIAGLVMSVFSGIAGSGGGLVMTPLAILLGLTPAQAISSGKFNGLAVAIGSLTGLGAHRTKINRRRVILIMILSFVIGLFVPFIIKSFESRLYQIVLGVLLLVLIPVMIRKKVGIKPHTPTRIQKGIGGILLSISLLLQGAFSGGLGSLVNIVLMSMLGQTANEAHITKRLSQLVLNVTVIFGVIGSGLIVWPVVVVGVSTTLVGSFLGGRVATKKGDTFAVNTMMVLMIVSATALIISAL